MKTKRFVKFAILTICLVMLVGSVPVSAVARPNKSPYSDVTVKKVGRETYDAVNYLKTYGAFRGIVKGKKFYPNKVVTRKEFILMLANLYGDDVVPVTAKDFRYTKTSTNVEGHRLIRLTKNLGNPVSWPVSKTTPRFTRALAARMIYQFIQLDKAFLPRTDVPNNLKLELDL